MERDAAIATADYLHRALLGRRAAAGNTRTQTYAQTLGRWEGATAALTRARLIPYQDAAAWDVSAAVDAAGERPAYQPAGNSAQDAYDAAVAVDIARRLGWIEA